jgi:hypothetical protein
MAALDGDEKRIVRLPNPRLAGLRGLIAQPSLQDGLVVPMISDTQFRYRPSHYFTCG